MKIVVVTNDDLKAELSYQGITEPAMIEWFNDLSKAIQADGEVYIDLLFTENREERMEILRKLPAKMVIINDVNGKNEKLPASFVRINGWPSLLKRPVIEAASGSRAIETYAGEIFDRFNKITEWTTDRRGFTTARIISMIINEAYFALENNVSSKEEIDIAMKLGTNYPYGPFEWCNLIGIKNIYSLLEELSKINIRYNPSDLLMNEAKS